MRSPEKSQRCPQTSEAASMASSSPTAAEEMLLPKSQRYRQREKWGHKVEFVLSCIGFCVGLGNVWRFPYLCYKNGGGAFLIPYGICLVAGGVPVFFLEIALGQYTSEGGITVWDICPLFRGIGYGTTIICFFLNIYYIIILSWAVLYLFYSFTDKLPWATCDNAWNTPECLTFSDLNQSALANRSAVIVGMTNHSRPHRAIDSVVEFWERKVLQVSSGIEHPGNIRWELAATLLLVWIICYFCIWKGVKSTGKVVYFTALFPYIMLTVLLVRGVTLPGALDGIIFYLRPNFSKLLDGEVWIDAGTQIFFSYAIALGCMTALASYNDFHNDFYKQCIFISCCNCSTSLYSGFAIFSVLGFMAKEQGVSIEEVAESGPGLAFIAYPKAVTQMPLSPLWATLFFFMILILGLDSQFVAVEGFITSVVDVFPHILRKGYRREYFIAATCIVSYLIGLSMVTNGGIYVFQLFDYFSASGMTLLWFCFFECAAIAWIYGAHQMYSNMHEMLGFTINPWLRWCWCFATPVVTASIFIFSLVTYKPLRYNRNYLYPTWAQFIGWLLALGSMICIPVGVCYGLLTTPGTLRQKWKILTTPTIKCKQDGKEREVMNGNAMTPICPTYVLAKNHTKADPAFV